MSSKDEHCKNDIRRHGESFPQVHEQLDSTTLGIGYAHRKDTHYLEHVLLQIKKRRWNKQEAAVALEHIMDDCGCIMLERDWKNGIDGVAHRNSTKE